jgi:hypothetical protein
MEIEERSPWESWILSSGFQVPEAPLDKIAELAVSSYNLKEKSRKESFKDLRHCFILWWMKNRRSFDKYQTITSVSKLLGIHHATFIHYMTIRKKSVRFESNSSCLIDFLTS